MSDAAAFPLMIGVSDGINSIDFGKAEDLSAFMRKLKIGDEDLVICGISFPSDEILEIAESLTLLATKILWVLLP